MKKLTTLIAILLCTVTLIAQAPEKFTYQAVVRNASNSLVSNAQVCVRVSLLQGSATGNAVYVETQSTTTNTNGLLSVEIGGGTVQQGSFANIDWANGPYFLKTEIDPNGGTNYSITSTQQMLSVPYALYAKESGDGFSGDYNDLTNTPTIPTIPTNVSAFTNDAGYITNADIPEIPTVPTNVSAFTNDVPYLVTEQQILSISNDTIFLTGGSFVKLPAASTGFSGDYNDLTNTPTIPTVPTNVSAFTNDAGYITMDSVPAIPTNVSTFTNDAGYITGYTETDPQYNAWDKDYNDLINRPTIPTIPTNVSAFINDVPYLTSEQQILSISNDTIFLTGGSFVKLPAASAGFSGNYEDLTNTPTIPTNVSQLENDANYITLEQVPAQVNADWNATSGAAEILNKPTLPAVPTDVSAFNNDAGYITSADIPEMPTVPTNVSAFNNDAGYITVAQCGDMDICALAEIITDLQAQVSELRSALDSLMGQDTQDTTNTVDTSTVHVVDGDPCPGIPTMTDADGNVYPTVQIGNQCWIKENLRTTQNNVGGIPLYTNSAVSQSSSLTSSVNPYRFAPHNDLSKVETYGYLYNWPAILGKNGPVNDNSTYCQGICPDGWHVPSSSDWQELMTYISNQPQYSCENNPVCTKNSLYDSIFVTNGINTSPNVNSTGFSLRASGYYFSCFMYQSGFVGQWTSSYGCWSDPCTMEGENYNYQFKSSHMPAYECMAVRCLKTPDEKIFSGAVTIGNYFFTDDTLVVEITDIVADGSPVTEVGACWSGGGPCINLFNAQTVSYDPSHSGPIYIKLSGVDTTGIIYFKAFINLEAGTIYSNLVSASTTYTFSPHACSSSPIVTDIDGNIYNTVQIGNQCWMRENLRTTHFADGSAIVGGGSLSYTIPYYYDNASSSIPLTDRGYYYNWTAVMHGASSSSANPSGVQGICPTGWHVPSDAEWSQLTNYMSSIPYYLCNSNDSSTFAKALSSKSYWAGNENACSIGYDLSTNNDSGFSAVPAGRRMSWVMYEGEHSTFSSCTEGTSDEEFWALDFNTYHPRVSRYPMSKDRGYSVRCLRD